MKITLSTSVGPCPVPRSVARILTKDLIKTAARNLAVLMMIAVLAASSPKVHASLPRWTGDHQLTSIAYAPNGGFWVQVDTYVNVLPGPDAWTIAHGAPEFENVAERGTIASIPGRNGYWVVTNTGQIFARGEAPELCGGELRNCSGFPDWVNTWDHIVGVASTPSGQGLWALGRNGKLWTAGDAVPYGDVQEDPQIATGIVATPSGNGYYIVMEDGGVFAFGDAVFFGSTGGSRPGGFHITGIALSIGEDGSVNGYWLVNEDGGVLPFGKVSRWVISGGKNGEESVTNIVSFPVPVPGQPPQRTAGYAWIHKDGRIGKATIYYPSPSMPGPPDPLPES
jgi:hypothetical protein